MSVEVVSLLTFGIFEGVVCGILCRSLVLAEKSTCFFVDSDGDGSLAASGVGAGM